MESEKDLSSLSTEALIVELAKRQQTVGVRPAVVEENFQKQGRNTENRCYYNCLRGLEAE
ncbi:MAG: hypothetical protein GY811_11455 [Myxococcales bacterium]|nr:hypothetical protein [Myxococcales bacterium]